MTKDKNRALAATSSYQRAHVSLKMGASTELSAEVEVTRGGLLSIAALVSAILLSTAALVHVARADRPPADR